MAMEYNIIVKTSPGELANAVDHELKAGWKPTGGVCAVQEKDNSGTGSHLLFFQAMIKGA
jgi:hypothetical protein